jgi:hypothetical protein
MARMRPTFTLPSQNDAGAPLDVIMGSSVDVRP